MCMFVYLYMVLVVIFVIFVSEVVLLVWLFVWYVCVVVCVMLLLLGDLNDVYDMVICWIGVYFDVVVVWLLGLVYWLYGDYYVGNLLYVGNVVNGVLDFDDVGQGVLWFEVVFVLFVLLCDVDWDDGFVFDCG